MNNTNKVISEGEKVIGELGDIWRLEKIAEETGSGCPKFVRINRELESTISHQNKLLIEAVLSDVDVVMKDIIQNSNEHASNDWFGALRCVRESIKDMGVKLNTI